MTREEKFKLILAEKPDAARRIASALGKKIIYYPKRGGLPLYEIDRDGDRIKIMSALGHLFTLRQSGKGWDYPVFNMEWVPRYEVERAASNTRSLVETIRELALGAESIIVATDYDVEGETIAYCILKYGCGQEIVNQAKRMMFSTLTDEDLTAAYEHQRTHIDFKMADAGETRHKVDWLFGINISRALILAVKNATGKYRTLSTGRVQGPTLTFIAERESAIKSFVPTPYWAITARAEIGGSTYPLLYSREKVPTKSQAEKVLHKCLNKPGIIKKIDTIRSQRSPPNPFDLGSLQAEAYKFLGYTPSKTLSIAERLYLRALISYPRTSSQKMPPSIEPRRVLMQLARMKKYEELASLLLKKEKLVPNQGTKDDPAHPPIIPTGTLPPEKGLSESESKVYDLVVRRFMSIYADSAVRQNIRSMIDIGGESFYLVGRRTVKEGWLKFYEPYLRNEERPLPELALGQSIDNIKEYSEERFTKPPPRYNPGTLLKLMEEHEIGTKATRAEIIDTLNRRGYVVGEKVNITSLGSAIIDVLRNYSPQILSVEMTRQLESDMENITFGETKGEEVISRTVAFLDPMLKNFKSKEEEIGNALDEALSKSFEKARTLGRCPVCKTGELIIIRSRKSGKRFVGCTNYRSGGCKFSAPIPQSGTAQVTGKTCQSCGFPTIIIRLNGRRPWELCINLNCKKNGLNKGKSNTRDQPTGS